MDGPMDRSRLSVTLAASFAMSVLPCVSGAQTYKQIAEYKLPGAAVGGIAVDAASRRILVATAEGIAVLNADTGARIGLVPLRGAQDVLVIPEPVAEAADEDTDEPAEANAPAKNPAAHPAARAYATGDGHIVSFTVDTLKPEDVGTLPTPGPSSLCFDADDRTVEAVSQGGSIATVDSASGKLTHSAQLPTGAGQIACGILHQVYVSDTNANVVHVLNSESGRNEGDLPMRSGDKPTGLALDIKGRRLFVSCEDGVIEIIDTDSGFTFIQLKGGNGPASETFAWTPQGKGQWKAAAFIAQNDGTLTGVRMNAFINYSIGGSYQLKPALKSIAYDETTHHLLLGAIRGGSPVVVVAGY